MKTTYKAQTTVHADIADTWNAVAQQNFVNEFFPEVKKDITKMSEYIVRTHKNTDRILPAYTVPNQSIGWATGGSTDIRLPRKDVKANIKTIDIELIEKGEYTTIEVEVVYAPAFDKNYVLAHRCVRGLTKIKLNVLKQEIEVNNNAGWAPAFA